MAHLFISHATEDDQIITRIHQLLTEAGVNAWVDHVYSVGPVYAWGGQVNDALNTCAAGLLVVTPTALESKYCTTEWCLILDNEKPLYLANLTPIPDRQLPSRLNGLPAVDFDENHLEQGVRALVDCLKKDDILSQLKSD